MSQFTEEVAAPEPAEVGESAPQTRLGLALALISAAQLMVVLDASIANIALPYLQADLGFSDANLSWVINSYTLAFGGLLLLGGRAGDLLGRRKVFMFGVFVFALASLFGGLAQTEGQLIAARVLQGLGAAVASPTALSLITTTFPAGPARNRAMGVYAAMSGAGAAIGLILGGALTEASWRWTFLINVPIGLLVVFLAPRVLRETEPQRGRFDLPGAVTGTAGLVSVVYGLTYAATHSWGSSTTIVFLAAGVLLLGLFLVIEARSTHALMPFRVLADRTRAVSYVAMLAIGSSMFAMFYFLSLFVQNVLGYSSMKAGLAFLPFSVGIVIGAQVASTLISRIDPRWIAGSGALVAGAGMFWLTGMTPDATYLTALLGPMVVISIGMGLVFVPLTLTAVSGVESHDAGVASAVLNTMQQVGGALGLAALATVATSAATDKAAQLQAALQQQIASGQVAAADAPGFAARFGLEAFTEGSTSAFLVGSLIVAAAAVLVYALLNVKHETLANDGEPVVMH